MMFLRPSKPVVLLCLFLTLLSISAPCFASTAEEVDASLKKGIDFLYAQQHNGNWETGPQLPTGQVNDAVSGGQWGGFTGIATYALLAAEQDPQDPRLKSAIEFLENANLRGVYSIAMRAQIWPFIVKQKKVKEFARRDAQLLLAGAKPHGAGAGFWFYSVDEPNVENTDTSVSQFAVLGIWACEETGVEIPSAFWRRQDELWRRDQNADGGWAYVWKCPINGWGNSTETMTNAGIASLYITQDKLVTVASRCQPVTGDQVIQRGIDFISAHYPGNFDDARGPGDSGWQMYLLFGLSRLGLASGERYFGANDWFKSGSDYLVKTQHADGSWGNSWQTAFAILFLARGRAPVAFNKLRYEDQTNKALQTWNVRPRDIANLSDWMGKSLERRINWQVVDIGSNPDDWLDAPVLYISRSDELKLTTDQEAKLRRFVESGGLILGNADCASIKFTNSFLKLGKALFPDYEFTELPADNPIYTNQQFARARWKTKPTVRAISNGVRQLMLLCPDADLGRAYATQSSRSRPELYEFSADVYEYMAGLNLRHRGDTNMVMADPAVKETRELNLARLKYSGNWDPEPGGWRRMKSILHNRDQINLTIQPVNLGDKLDGFKLVNLTGTTPITLNPDQRKLLLNFVNSGGTLLVDSAGGSTEFAASMSRQLADLFGKPLETIPPDADLYKIGEKPLSVFGYSRFAKSTLGSLNTPRLKGIRINQRLAVIFSADDLTLGMVGAPVDGVVGLTPDTAVEMVRRIALQSLLASPK